MVGSICPRPAFDSVQPRLGGLALAAPRVSVADSLVLSTPPGGIERVGAAVTRGLGGGLIGAAFGAAGAVVGMGVMGVLMAGAGGLGLAVAFPSFIAAGAVVGGLASAAVEGVRGAVSGTARPDWKTAAVVGAAVGGLVAPGVFVGALNCATRGYGLFC